MTETEPAKIIIVEDDTDLRDSLIECLELHGNTLIGVPSALGFYQTISAKSFDIAIIDIGLPDQSGFEIVHHLKNTTKMGIVVLTALGSAEARIEGYEQGADLYLVKPTECRELAAAITNLHVRQQDSQQTHPENTTLWTLNRPELQLITTSKFPVTLTVREASFLHIMMSAPGTPIQRHITCQLLGFDANNSKDRRMDSMIRRLRQKTKKITGFNLPIQTIYKSGYVFSGRALTI